MPILGPTSRLDEQPVELSPELHAFMTYLANDALRRLSAMGDVGELFADDNDLLDDVVLHDA